MNGWVSSAMAAHASWLIGTSMRWSWVPMAPSRMITSRPSIRALRLAYSLIK